jgi:hypothetical protein
MKLKVITPVPLTDDEKRYREVLELSRRLSDPHKRFREILDRIAFKVRTFASKELREAARKFKSENSNDDRRKAFQQIILTTLRDFSKNDTDENKGKHLLYYYLEDAFGFKTLIGADGTTIFQYPSDDYWKTAGVMNALYSAITKIDVTDILHSIYKSNPDNE